VLGVKPAFEEDDAQVFLAFHCATVEVKIESNFAYVGESRAKALQGLADER
jgi:hypothetical protein